MKLHIRLKGGPGSGGQRGADGRYISGSTSAEKMYVFHGTRQKFVDSIFKDGLKAGPEKIGRPGSVYFTTNPEEARNFSHYVSSQGHSTEFNTFALVKFELTPDMQKAMVKDEYGEDFGYTTAYRIERDIPASAIVSVDIGTMQTTMEGYNYNVQTTQHRTKENQFGYALVLIKEA